MPSLVKLGLMTKTTLAALRMWALLIAGCAVTALPGPANGQQAGQTITAIIAAGSINNTVNILVTNANSWSTLRTVRFAVADTPRYIDNLSFDPPQLDELAPNSAHEVTVSFDVTPEVPDEGAQETVTIRVAAAGGLLDQSQLTLKLGIETEATPLNIVPFVVGMRTEDAAREIVRSGLEAVVEQTSPPADPALFDTVAAQGTPAGDIVPAGARIALTVFPKSAIRVPEVAGLKVDEATRIVTEAGLRPQVTPLGEAPSEDVANTVERSDPRSGAHVVQGATVALFVYGSVLAEPEPQPEGSPEASVAGDWGRPWRGELKLTLLIADGQAMSLAEAIRRYSSQPEPEPEVDEEVGILAAPGAVAGEVAGAISEGVAEGIGEAMAMVVSGIAGMLEAGAPLSFTLVKEQGGFRLRIPGSTPFIDKLNEVVANLPLLLPEGGNLLTTTLSRNESESSGTLTTEITASPDWTELTIRVSLKGTQTGAPRSVELVLTGTARQGLYEPAVYETDVMTRFGLAVQRYATEAGIAMPSLGQD